MFINFRIFLLALASGFQPPWSLPSICRKPTKSSSSRLLHLGLQPRRFSASDWGNPRSKSRTLTGHRMSPDPGKSGNRSSPKSKQILLDLHIPRTGWMGNRGPQSDSPSWSWRRDLQLLALAKSSWSHSLAAGVEDSKIWERYEVWSFCNDFKPKIGQNMLEFDARFC